MYGVIPANDSVDSFSEVPVLPATGRSPKMLPTSGAVPLWSHLPYCELLLTGQRAASAAALKTSLLTVDIWPVNGSFIWTWWQLEKSVLFMALPLGSVIDTTGF